VAWDVVRRRSDTETGDGGVTLLELLLHAREDRRAEHWIVGRDPNCDWFGVGPDDPEVTSVIRINRADLDELIAAMEPKPETAA
jgi:hypothetical protein